MRPWAKDLLADTRLNSEAKMATKHVVFKNLFMAPKFMFFNFRYLYYYDCIIICGFNLHALLGILHGIVGGALSHRWQ